MQFKRLRRNLNTPLFFSNTRGAAAAEFAIIAPVFLLILFGIIAYGIYFGASSSVQQLSADAARASIAGLDEEERVKLAENFIRRNAGRYVLLNPEYVTVAVEGSKADPDQFDVSISYDADKLPIWNLYAHLPLPSRTIIRTATIRLGGI